MGLGIVINPMLIAPRASGLPVLSGGNTSLIAFKRATLALDSLECYFQVVASPSTLLRIEEVFVDRPYTGNRNAWPYR